jgi:uncharacterized protein YjgD (DUF1641 family)
MAHPITFKPKPVDPQKELMSLVEAAPREHAVALLALWDTLQTAHDKGVLDLAKGLISGKDIITGKIAEAASLPESVAAIRNGMAMARVLGSIDPDMLQRMAKALGGNPKEEGEQERMAAEKEGSALPRHAAKSHHDQKPPSLWQIFKMATSADARRGIGFSLKMLTALGRAQRSEE